MSVYFQYDVTAEARSSCLDMLQRAAERVARGGQAFLGQRGKPDRKLGRSTRKRNSVSSELRQRVFALRDQGFSRDQIVRECRSSKTRIDYILYNIGRTPR